MAKKHDGHSRENLYTIHNLNARIPVPFLRCENICHYLFLTTPKNLNLKNIAIVG